MVETGCLFPVEEGSLQLFSRDDSVYYMVFSVACWGTLVCLVLFLSLVVLGMEPKDPCMVGSLLLWAAPEPHFAIFKLLKVTAYSSCSINNFFYSSRFFFFNSSNFMKYFITLAPTVP